MKLSKHCDYAFRVVLLLACDTRRVFNTREIADAYGISRDHISKVAKNLNKLGFTESVQGRSGGIRLKMDPSEINLGDLIRKTEISLDLVECFQEVNKCKLTPICRLPTPLSDALGAFFQVLSQYQLSDVLGDKNQVLAILDFGSKTPD